MSKWAKVGMPCWPFLQQTRGSQFQNGLPYRGLGDIQFPGQLGLHDPVTRLVVALGDLLRYVCILPYSLEKIDLFLKPAKGEEKPFLIPG